MHLYVEQLSLLAQSPGCRRWNRGRASHRPPGEVFDPRYASIQVIDERTAKDFVLTHHYTHSYPAARFRVGVFVKKPFAREKLGGVAVFSVPMSQAVLPAYFPDLEASEGVELGRFVLLDELEANAETWMLGKAFRALAENLPQIKGVLAFCDPVERCDVDGRIVKASHRGTIYRAHNGRFVGRSGARSLFVTTSGSVVSSRAISKLRNGECGSDYCERQLIACGASPRRCFEKGSAYLRRLADEEGFLRKERHPGNLAFAWRLRTQVRRSGAATLKDGTNRR